MQALERRHFRQHVILPGIIESALGVSLFGGLDERVETGRLGLGI